MGLVRSILGILILSLLVYQTSVGQQITVVDHGTGQPVENVALFNKDKSVSAISDAYGKADLGLLHKMTVYFYNILPMNHTAIHCTS